MHYMHLFNKLTIQRKTRQKINKVLGGMGDTEIFHVARERREESRFPQTAFQTYHIHVFTFQLKPKEKRFLQEPYTTFPFLLLSPYIIM